MYKFPLLIGAIFLASACADVEKPEEEESTTDDTQSSQPSQPETTPGEPSQPSAPAEPLYYTNLWAGEATIADNTWTGWESHDVAQDMDEPDTYNCQLVWDTAGTPSTLACDGCEFAYDITVTPQEADYIVNDGSCDFTELSFSYGYNPAYEYNGETLTVMMYAASGDDPEFGAWFASGNEYPTGDVSSITWDETTGAFNYQTGYRNYEYIYGQ